MFRLQPYGKYIDMKLHTCSDIAFYVIHNVKKEFDFCVGKEGKKITNVPCVFNEQSFAKWQLVFLCVCAN